MTTFIDDVSMRKQPYAGNNVAGIRFLKARRSLGSQNSIYVITKHI